MIGQAEALLDHHAFFRDAVVGRLAVLRGLVGQAEAALLRAAADPVDEGFVRVLQQPRLSFFVRLHGVVIGHLVARICGQDVGHGAGNASTYDTRDHYSDDVGSLHLLSSFWMMICTTNLAYIIIHRMAYCQASLYCENKAKKLG